MLTRRMLIGGAAVIVPSAFMSAHAQTGGGVETIIVPFAAGGPADLTARTLRPVLSQRLQRNVIVENRAGAGGVTGLNAVASSTPDGRTIGFATVGAMAMAPHMMTMPFDPTRDLAYIGLIGKASELLVASSQLPVQTFSEFLDYARKNPGKVTIASTGTGSIAHLAIELLKTKAGIDVVHVPYRGAAPAVVDVMSGQVNAVIGDVSNFVGQSKSDRLRPLMLAGDKRSAVMPDVPTAAESGLPGYEVENWYAFVAAKNTPTEQVMLLNGALNAALQNKEVLNSFAKVGVVALGGAPEALRDFEREEFARWGEVIRNAGIRIN